MEAIYPYAKLVHIICAIIFLGYVFFDVVILSGLKKTLGADFERVKEAIVKRAIKIMPVCFFVLLMSGGMMMSSWVGLKAGSYFETTMQQLLMAKALLALLIGLGVLFSLLCRAFGRQSPAFMRRHFHKIVLFFGFVIVVLAKMMFYI